MADTHVTRVNVAGGLAGVVWLIGWLFTMGYLHLRLVRAVFALVIWPYYLGAHLGH